MKQTWKRILAYVLTIAMLLGVMPDVAIVSYAEEVEQQNTTEVVVEEEPVTEQEEADAEVTSETVTTEAVTETETTETLTEEVTTETEDEQNITEATTEAAEEIVTETTTEAATEEMTETSTTELSTEENTTEVEEDALKPIPVEVMASVQSDGLDPAYIIYNDGTWEPDRYRWYVNVDGKKHYVFCLDYGKTMWSGLYYGNLTAGYSGYNAFKKAVALNYFYKVNGNSWNGTKGYGDVQYAIWDSKGTETSGKLLDYASQAWKLTSLNANRQSGSASYSSKLKGIKKSEQDSAAARKEMIADLTDGKNIIDLSNSPGDTPNSYQKNIKLNGSAWKYFVNGGFNGGASDIVVDGVYDTDGKIASDSTAAIDANGNLAVNIIPTETMGKDKASAYTVIMHVEFDYKGSDSLNYLFTPEGKQNLTYDANFNTAAYFAIRVYGDAPSVDFEPAELYINKVDEFGNFVPGCEFLLTGVQGDATNMNPQILVSNDESHYFEVKDPGYYKLEETAVPSPEYQIDTTEHYVYAEYNDNNELLLYEAWKSPGGTYGYIDPDAAVIGGDSGNHQGAKTAKFHYYFPNEYNGGNATLIKNANVLVKYENGKFVYEKRTLDDVGFSFYTAEDIYINDTLVLSKDEEIYSGTPWGGYFTDNNGIDIYKHKVNIDGKLVQVNSGVGTWARYKGYTAQGGKITISDLPPGSYYCVESDLSHPGVVMSLKRYYFDVVAGETATINGSEGIVNEQAPTDVYVYKQDGNTKEYLSGAEITVYANINNTNYDGKKLFDVNQTVDVVVERNLATGEETVRSNTWIPIQTSVTNDKGVAIFDNLPYGDYLIAETKAPEGYELPEKAIQFTHVLPDNAADYASGFSFSYTIEDIKTNHFMIYKNAEKAYLNTAAEKNVDAYVYKAEKVAGVVFGIYAETEIKNTLGEVVFEKGDLVTKCTTDEDGIAHFGGAIFAGKYYYQEMQTADDSRYELDTTRYYFEVTGTEGTKELTDEAILNKLYKGSIKVIKTDGETKVSLEGVEFNLLDAEKKVIGTYVTDVNGEINIKNLPVGTYYIQETKTKDKYILDDTLREVSISKENLNHELSITNEKYKGSIKVIKTDGKTKVALSGVEFTLFDAGKNKLGKYKTDKNGEILIDNLDVGTYYLQETKTKKGYKLNDEMIEVVISAEDLHQLVEIENERADTKITIRTDTNYSGSGKVRTGDVTPLMLIMLLFIISSLGVAYFAKKNKRTLKPLSVRTKKFMILALVLTGVICLGGLTVKAAAELKELSSEEMQDVEYNGTVYEYALQKQYETSDQEEEIVFEDEVDGMKLAEVQYETLETILQKKTVEETKDYKDLLVKDESKVADTITIDGQVYELKDITWLEVPNLETVSYTVDYGYWTTEPTPDETYEYTYTSPVTKKDNTVELPFVRLEKGSESWVEGFTATVTFHNLDGVYFTLGNHEFEYNPDNLSLTESDYTELVKLLGYDTSRYRLTSIAWSGGEYKKDGQTCRDAKASGQQYAAAYKAIYEDEIENGKIYTAHATYTCEVEVPADEAEPTYIKQATAYYENASVWTNIITFITEHQAVSVVFIGILLIIIILLILLLLKKRRKAGYQSEEVSTE